MADDLDDLVERMRGLEDRVTKLSGTIEGLAKRVDRLEDGPELGLASARDRYDASVLQSCLEAETDVFDTQQLAAFYRQAGISDRRTLKRRVRFLTKHHFEPEGYGKYRLQPPASQEASP